LGEDERKKIAPQLLLLASTRNSSSVVAFLSRDIEIEKRDESGVTPLCRAILDNKPQVLQELLDQGANVNNTSLVDGQERSPLLIAVRNNCHEIIRVLLLKAPQVKDFYDGVFEACVNNQADIVRTVLGAIPLAARKGIVDDFLMRALASKERVFEILYEVVKADINLNQPCDVAGFRRHIFPKICNLGVSNIPDKGQIKLLDIAILLGNEEVVKKLMAANGIDYTGNTINWWFFWSSRFAS
jgi:ankyrin repeat protein